MSSASCCCSTVAELEPVAWLLAGLLLASTTPRGRYPRAHGRPPGGRRPRHPRALLAVAAGGLDVAADRQAEAATAASRRGDPTAAARAAAEAVDLRPDELRLHLLLARTLRRGLTGRPRA